MPLSPVQGSQAAQTFTVTYSDNSTATFTQSFSDWANQQSYPGETKLITMAYRNLSGGSSQNLKVSVDGYQFVLDQTKAVKNIILPSNANLIVLSIILANDPVSANLSTYYNRTGIFTDGITYTNPVTGGVDGGGYSYSGTLLGSSQMWTNTLFTFGPMNTTNVISGANQTILLPAGNYSRLQLLAAAVNGSQSAQSFVVTYTDASTTTFSQGVSDWFSPQNYTGESKAIPMGYRNYQDGSSSENNSLYFYGYSFLLNSAKTIQSVRLPNNGNVIVAAIRVVPNWQPTFVANTFYMANFNVGASFSANIASNASDLNGDALTFSKLSGPAWLNVAANGALSGTPANLNANTNSFVVSVRDTGGLSNTTTYFINVNAAPTFTANPFYVSNAIVGQSYSGSLATNASDPNAADMLTFAKLSGPAWLNIATNGVLSGIPANADANTNVFNVSVRNGGGLSNTSAFYLYVDGAPMFVANPFTQPEVIAGLSYSGSMATNVFDPNPTDSFAFSKVSGPVWLIVATNGLLSGVPLSANVGTNTFIVSVFDSSSLSGAATMTINVLAAPAIVSSFSPQSGGFLLEWSGGVGPFQVQQATNLINPDWQNINA